MFSSQLAEESDLLGGENAPDGMVTLHSQSHSHAHAHDHGHDHGHDHDDDGYDQAHFVDEEDWEEMILDGPAGKEWGGPRRGGKLAEPTRFGDWERKGRCTDFS
uniref:Succinate dehydrogenase assembly factor 4, mitochondrial n=2 Tax=Phaeomonas parva TaxID=124430 RepID=A0A7S1XVT7_9STRA|mmetsp:Transcript_38391/g.120342  ORF Transcript_38391/g.120342 Transcript_38391/m.120342 type:complete len:104 (+) Transcript_38391:349-660(+)